MLNLIIKTQYKENYAINEDGSMGTGADAYWKFKGGSTYLVTDIDFINTEYLEGLVEETAFIHSYENPASMEYVLDWELIDEENLSDHIEEWESPYILEKNEKGQWTSKKVTENGDMGYMKSEILSKVAVWTYESNGTRDVESYHVEYVMVDGTKVVGEKSLGEWFENLETEVA